MEREAVFLRSICQRRSVLCLRFAARDGAHCGRALPGFSARRTEIKQTASAAGMADDCAKETRPEFARRPGEKAQFLKAEQCCVGIHRGQIKERTLPFLRILLRSAEKPGDVARLGLSHECLWLECAILATQAAAVVITFLSLRLMHCASPAT
jgi:hypothetical protein